MFQLLSTIDIDTQRKRVVGRVLLLGISSKLTAARERVLRHVLQMHSGVECAGAAETPFPNSLNVKLTAWLYPPW
jgi:hypothetical protein